MALDLERLLYMPETDILKATGCVIHYKDHWWMVKPGKGLVFWAHNKKYMSLERSTPQCNANEATAKHLMQKLYPDGGMEVRQFVSVLVPMDPRDYQ
jgi:hypothetical protein